MSKHTEADITFQNTPLILRCAPWLDMPALRAACQEELLQVLNVGTWSACYTEFLADAEEFVLDERSRIPRADRSLLLVRTTIEKAFPASAFDKKRSRDRTHIYPHLMQRFDWSIDNRGSEK